MISILKTLSEFSVILLTILSCQKDDTVSSEININNFPFPNHTAYLGDHIKPNNFTQTELDDQTFSFFNSWKNRYLKNDCNSSEYYIETGNDAKTVSEAHGYGMMIMCFMSNSTNNTKAYYDGLFAYYKSHPSNINNSLMDWQQITCTDSPDTDDNSASDGDIDIAFSLLLANKQWGSDGNINYLSEAKKLINAIIKNEINSATRTVKLGDWSNSDEPDFYYGTRSSDFITSHFKVFSTITNNDDWNTVVDNCYDITNTVQNPTTGLVPDFIVNTNSTAIPANPNYLESAYDGDYYYNACRLPWRLGTDYLVTGDIRGKIIVNKLNTWLNMITSGNVQNISNGYKLNGTAIYNWNDPTFTGPLTVGAMTDEAGQTWLNNLYLELLNNSIEEGDYYSNTLKLLSMITISGNYWNP